MRSARLPARAPDALVTARDLLRLSATDPERAGHEALPLLADSALPPAVRAVAATAAGQSALYLGNVAEASEHLAAAVRTARRSAAAEDLGRALLARGPLLLELGRPGAAARSLAEAAHLLQDGDDLLRLAAHRAHLAYVRGRMDEAALRWDEVVARLDAAGTPSERLATALHNRALALSRLRRDDEARADLVRAASMFAGLGVDDGVATAQTHLGWIAARGGDVAEALRRFEDGGAHGSADDLGEDDAHILSDLAAALLAARLLPEAATAASRAATALAAAGATAASADAALHGAQARLGMGDLDRVAQEVSALLNRRPRPAPSTVALARYLLLQADVARAAQGSESGAHGASGPDLLVRARASVRDLTRAGWPAEALAARLLAARLAADLGRTALSRQLLALDPQARSRGPVHVRCAAWHGRALLHLADGDRRGAARAVRAGLATLDVERAGLSGELRASVAGHGGELARLGVRLAVDDGDAAAVLRAGERWRAAALLAPAGRPPDDPELARDVAALRDVTARVRTAALHGDDTARLRARQSSLEATVRRRARLAPASPGASSVSRRIDVAALRTALGERMLVEFVAEGDRLLAVTLASDLPPRLHDVGTLSAAVHEVRSLHFALRMLGGGGPPQLARQATGLFRDAAQRLDVQLGEPLRRGGTDRPLVVVPTADLHALPWAMLPGCAGRAVTSVPSAALWWRAHQVAGQAAGQIAGQVAGQVESQDDAATGLDVLVAGPGLRHADAEVADVAALRPSARVLTGDAARVDDVLAAMDGARLAHVASHGTFRSDNPLFSSLRLADGPLTVHDLHRLHRAPDLTVLSACNVGMSEVRAGDEVLGVVAALLGLGGRTLVASVVPVRDAESGLLMTGLHRHLAAGRRPSEALALARVELDDAAALATAGMTCFGVG